MKDGISYLIATGSEILFYANTITFEDRILGKQAVHTVYVEKISVITL